MNEKNLIPNEERTPRERRENARKAGIASGKARREKKTIQNILKTLFESKCKDLPQYKKICNQLGLDDEQSVKQLYTYLVAFNNLKRASLEDLIKISIFLGEMQETTEEDTSDLSLEELKEMLVISRKEKNKNEQDKNLLEK